MVRSMPHGANLLLQHEHIDHPNCTCITPHMKATDASESTSLGCRPPNGSVAFPDPNPKLSLFCVSPNSQKWTFDSLTVYISCLLTFPHSINLSFQLDNFINSTWPKINCQFCIRAWWTQRDSNGYKALPFNTSSYCKFHVIHAGFDASDQPGIARLHRVLHRYTPRAPKLNTCWSQEFFRLPF